jgi:hypothetical protein
VGKSQYSYVVVVLVFSPRASLGRNQSPVRLPLWFWYAASWSSSGGEKKREIWRHENNFMGQWDRTLTWIVPRTPVKMGSLILSLTDILVIVDRRRQKNKRFADWISHSLRLRIEMGERAATRSGRVETVSTGRYSLKHVADIVAWEMDNAQSASDVYYILIVCYLISKAFVNLGYADKTSAAALRRGTRTACLLGLRVRIPSGHECLSVSCELFVVSGADQSLIQRNHTECVRVFVSECVFVCSLPKCNYSSNARI